jgi:fatty-acyl-CoA synthase
VPLVNSEIAHWIPDPDARPALREMTVCELLEEAVERWPQREALLYSYPDLGLELRWSFAGLGARLRDVAAALMASGSRSGLPTSPTRCCSSPAALRSALSTVR